MSTPRVLRHSLRPLALAAAAACAIAALGPAGARAHGPAPGADLDRAAEQRMRAAETALLGAEHALEHARLREYAQSPGRWRRQRRAHRTAVRTARAAAVDPLDVSGRWADRFDIPVFAINAIMLPTGKVLWFAYPNSPDRPPGPQHGGVAWLWDPAAGTDAEAFEEVAPPIDPVRGEPVNLFCAGASFLADGRVLVTGGNLAYPSETPGAMYAGLDDVYTFDPFTETWTQQPDMNHGRWYPSQLLMPDGRTFIMGGLDEDGHGHKNEDLELFTPSAEMDGIGSIGFLGPEGLLGDPGQPPVGDYYPHLFWMPSGRGLVAGPYTIDSWWFDPPGDPPVFQWDDIENFAFSRVWGSAVLVPDAPSVSHEVLQLGGSDVPAAGAGNALATDSAASFDEADADPEWDTHDRADGDTDVLNVARSHLNTVLLPDGSMVTVGGGDGRRVDGSAENGAPGQYAARDAQLQTELWDPDTRTWRLGPPQLEYRTYHSTALLLPDGRVVSAGDDYNGRHGDDRDFTQDSAEIYEPPYLFDGDALAPRPAVADAPETLGWTHSYEVAVEPAAGREVTEAVLVAPGAATHAVDMNQRHVPLAVTGGDGDSIAVTAPASADVAPPGYYMLFVLDETGTPSVASWVRVGPFSEPDPDPTPTPDPPPPPPRRPPAPPPKTEPPPTADRTTVRRKPHVRARLVRRHGRRFVRLRVADDPAPAARVRLRLRTRRGRTLRRATVTVRTGRRTLLRDLRVPRRARRVRATVGALTAMPRSRARIVRAGGRRRVRLRVEESEQRRAGVKVTLRGSRRRRAFAEVRTGRSTVLRHLRVPRATRSVRVVVRALSG